jgi:hypothetical protein
MYKKTLILSLYFFLSKSFDENNNDINKDKKTLSDLINSDLIEKKEDPKALKKEVETYRKRLDKIYNKDEKKLNESELEKELEKLLQIAEEHEKKERKLEEFQKWPKILQNRLNNGEISESEYQELFVQELIKREPQFKEELIKNQEQQYKTYAMPVFKNNIY